jgi:hypothetical protein
MAWLEAALFGSVYPGGIVALFGCWLWRRWRFWVRETGLSYRRFPSR